MKKYFIAGALLALIALAGFGKPQYIPGIENQVSNPDYTLLIITEDTSFKGKIITQLQSFRKDNRIGVTILVSPDFSKTNTDGYDAVLFMWHLESNKLPSYAARYLNSVKDKTKYILLASYGDGKLNADYNVDAVSGASASADPAEKAEEIINILKEKLGLK